MQDNIQRILNTAVGASRIYRHLPASAHTLKREIEITLLRYEPRLKAINIAIFATSTAISDWINLFPRGKNARSGRARPGREA